MTLTTWTLLAAAIVAYLAIAAVTYGIARNYSLQPEPWTYWGWLLVLVLHILGHAIKAIIDGLDRARCGLIDLGERWGARLNRGGAT